MTAFVPAFFVTNRAKQFLRWNPTKNRVEWCWERKCADSFSTYREAIDFRHKLPKLGATSAVIVDQLGDIWTPARARLHGF